MRIITGKARGVRLDTLDGLDTRPTSERSKEAIFSMLQFELEDRVVLDLFAGSGQMGLEALSRGARSAYLVDSGKRAIEVIKKNIQKTRLEGANAICSDSLSFLRRCAEKEKFDIVFLDPPYATELINEALCVLVEEELIKDTTYLVCESDRFDFLNAKNAANFDVIKTMKHGIAHISVLKKKEAI
jgi:16S rRNA (guanine(966)-N(2))-methyltransferase RsmD